ncbi:MAG TPA: hypothetical protein VND65_13320 [Candidatus Binatia bacterium]|nr:hypothetical protein [Candidatus Binatia bacterium]
MATRFSSLDKRIRELFATSPEGIVAPASTPVQPHSGAMCKRSVSPDGKLFWSFMWPELQSSPREPEVADSQPGQA